MRTFERSSLWRDCLAPCAGDPEADPREELRSCFTRFRELASTLAAEIPEVFKSVTVHDVTHCDALWEIASIIAGGAYRLTASEAFVLGGAFLLHDLGMALASYPNGLNDLKRTDHWQDMVAILLRRETGRYPREDELSELPPHIEQAAIAQVLRELHAEQAEHLGTIKFTNAKTGDECHLIEHSDIRSRYGHLIGRIAHSHWWPVSRLRKEFREIIGATPGHPPEWTVDPLKVACLLRVADACHLDERRAPHFLEMLRKPTGISARHWRFQSYLQTPRVDEQRRCVFTTTRPFPPADAEAWWLCHDTLKMADDELRKVDSLLGEAGRQTLAANRVAGIDDVKDLSELVTTNGWTPIDTRVRVSNVVSLIEQLGGAQFYGNDLSVPLRELIQNASDAVRARRSLEQLDQKWGRITVQLGADVNGSWIEIADNGIGMSQAVLSGPLLDFASSYWESPLAAREHPSLFSKGFEPTGRYGIGFFSSFMWGPRVRVVTRQQEDGISETRVLEFVNGVESMPILRAAYEDERLTEPGTSVRIWFSDSVKALFDSSVRNRSMVFRHSCEFGLQRMDVSFAEFCAWLCPTLDVDLFVDEGRGAAIAVKAGDWKDIPAIELLMRTLPQPVSRTAAWPDEALERLAQCVRPLRDSCGNVLGRGCFATPSGLGKDTWRRWNIHLHGTVTAGAFRASETTVFAGVLLGRAVRALRDHSRPLADAEAVAAWASEQAGLVANIGLSTKHLLLASMGIRSVGGATGPLPIAQDATGHLSFGAVEGRSGLPDSIIVVNQSDWQQLLKERPEAFLNENVLVVEYGPLGNMREICVEDFRKRSEPGYPEFRWNTPLGAVAEAIAKNWGVELSEVLKTARFPTARNPDIIPVAVNGDEVVSSKVLAVFSRPG